MATEYRFPHGFLWGTATSAHQVEGDNQASDWWEYEQQGRLRHQSGDACRHYQEYERDFDLAQSLGQNAHRFSIEWSRIEPVPGGWDEGALEHYQRVVAALRIRNLEPLVTLHHFTNPAWFLRRGGWTRRDSVDLFARYVRRVADALAPSVKYWLTINEPIVYVMEGYILGEWPPRLTRAWMRAAIVLRHLARAHGVARRLLRERRPDAMVSFAHSAPVIQPCDPARLRDRWAAALRDAVLNRAFFRLIGARPNAARPTEALDFVAINYYTRQVVRSAGVGLGTLVGRDCRQPHHGDDGPRSDMGWEVYPAGLTHTLERFSRYGVPIIITENGIATDDDRLRRTFVKLHVAAMGEAIDRGVDLRGYCHWSLIDNFEWAYGRTVRFGLAAVEFATQERTLRPSAHEFAQVCRDNRVLRAPAGDSAEPPSASMFRVGQFQAGSATGAADAPPVDH
jgi:beta-glucosidase